MPVINQIIPRRAVLTSAAPVGYAIKLEWETLQSPGECYTGPFYVLRYVDGIFQEASPIELTDASHGRVTALPAAKGAVTLRISAGVQPEPAAAYPAIPVLQEGYRNIRGEFDGAALFLSWSTMDAPGELTLSPLGGTGRTQCFALPQEDGTVLHPAGGTDAGWQAVLRTRLADPQGEWVSLGAPTEVFFCAAFPTLNAVDADDTTLTITYTVPAAWSSAEAAQSADCTLLRDGVVGYRWPSQTPEKHDEAFRLKLKLPEGAIRSRLSSYTLAVACGGAHSLCTKAHPQAQIPLAPPLVETEINGEGCAVIRWVAPSPEDGFAVATGETVQTVYEREQSLPLVQVLDQSVRVAALYGTKQCRGPYSAAVSFRKDGFYPDEATGALRWRGLAEGKCAVSLPTSLFTLPLEKPISSGPFQLEEIDGASVLTLDLGGVYAYEKLEELVKLLFENKITPAGYYRLREVVSRLSPVPAEEVLCYCCAAKKNGLSLDLLPGLLLKTETAYYNRQTAPTDADNNGFIRGAVGEYPVALTGDTLEMDSLFQHTVGSWSGGGAQTYPRPAAGLNDFFYAPVRSAYYRLCFPKSFPDSSAPSTYNAADNICLMALRPCDATPPDLERVNQPGLLLRGRTSVTVYMEVLVNGAPVSVPLGTALDSLLARYAASPRTAKLFRRGTNGPAPVFLGTVGQDTAGALPLLPGDRIEV